MKAGNDKDRSLAIAFSVQRQARAKKKMADGGEVKTVGQMIGYPGSEPAPQPTPAPKGYAKGGMIEAIMRKRKMAEGGEVDHNDQIDPASDFDMYAEDAIDDGMYDMSQVEDQPEDSNEHSVMPPDEDAHDMVSALRKRIREKRGM